MSVPPPEVVVTIPFLSKPLFKDKEFLHQRYCQEGLSLAQIAAEIGSSKEAVRKGLCRFGIAARAHGQHHGHPSQARFGIRVIKGQSLPHLAEKKVIEAVCGYRSQGFTLRQIAEKLGESDIKSKNRGTTWHPEMIRRILRCKKATKTAPVA